MPHPIQPSAQPRRGTPRPLSPRWAWTATGVLALVLVALACLGLWHLRSEALLAQQRELALLGRALADETDRGLQGVEEGLRVVRRELLPGGAPGSVAASRASLRAQAELMPLVSALWLVDLQGRPGTASHDAPPPAWASLQGQVAGTSGDRVAFSDPVLLPSEAEPGIAMALPFGTPAGQPTGWLLAGVPARSLLGAFAAAAPDSGAAMAVLRADGTRIAASGRGGAGPAEARLTAEHLLPRYGIRVQVTRDLAGVLQAWRQTAEATVAVLLLLLATLAAAVHFALLAARRHAEAQQAVQLQLARAGRLQALGTLAGGVAHDFNNVLAAVVGYGEMAQDEAVPGSDQARHLDKVLQAALRGRALVERILGFSRGGARVSVVFALQPVVEEVLALLSASLRPGVVLERALAAPAGHLRGDPTRAFEAVMNLCTNAMQAMPRGGMLTVELSAAEVGGDRVLSHGLLGAGHYLQLAVADQGVGIAPESMDHLFEPFFTTRAAESGTGLGLAVVHAVVAEFHGAIDVRSVPGAGSRFTLYLPLAQEAADPQAPAAQAARRGAGQRVLVVDDQPDLVAVMQRMLHALGYEAVGHTDAAAALRALREQPADYAALITDEVMPGLPGTALARAARELLPGLPVLLVSGYGGEGLAERAADAGVTRVLAKPLQRAELARALQEVLPA